MGSATRIPTCAGKTVLVTGAAGTLGQATAISFAVAGVARLAVVDHVDVLDTREQALQAALDAGNPAPDVLALVVDVCDVASVEAGVREVSSAWDHVDIFVNVAASSSKPAIARGDVTGLRDADARWKVWEANAKGISLMARALVPLLSRGSDRTIVNAATVFSDDLAASAIDSQFSVLALTQISECLMLDNAHEGLLVYSVNPNIDLRGRVPAAVGQVMDVRRSNFIVHLTGRRRDWLAGRHVGSVEDLLELQARDEDSAGSSPLKAWRPVEMGREVFVLPWTSRRGRVPRSSY